MFFFALLNLFLIPKCSSTSQGDVSNFFTSYIPHSDYIDLLHAERSNLKSEELENTRGKFNYVSSDQLIDEKYHNRESYQNPNSSSGLTFKNEKELSTMRVVLSNSSINVSTKSKSGGIMNFFSNLIQKNGKTNAAKAQVETMLPARPVNSSERKINGSNLENPENQTMFISPAIIKSAGNLREPLIEQNMEDSKGGKQCSDTGKLNIFLPEAGDLPSKQEINARLSPEVGKYDFTNASVDDFDEAINKFLDDYGVKQLNSALRRLRPPSVITPDGYLIQPVAYIDQIPKQDLARDREGRKGSANDYHSASQLRLGNLFEECNLTQRIAEYEKAHPELLREKNQLSKPT